MAEQCLLGRLVFLYNLQLQINEIHKKTLHTFDIHTHTPSDKVQFRPLDDRQYKEKQIFISYGYRYH